MNSILTKNLFDFDEPLFNLSNFFGGSKSSLLKTDIEENDNEYIVSLDVPGFDKKDVKIALEDGYVTVTVKKEEHNEDKKYLLNERFIGEASRSFYVGDVEVKDIQASFDKGVLTLTISKRAFKEAEEKKYINIK